MNRPKGNENGKEVPVMESVFRQCNEKTGWVAHVSAVGPHDSDDVSVAHEDKEATAMSS